MDWADELAASVTGPQVVNDSKTPSGTVHVGSLRGPVVHDAICRALSDLGTPASSYTASKTSTRWTRQALLTPDAVDRYMGVPLANVPAPAGQRTRRTTRATSWASSCRRSSGWASRPSSTG